METLIELRTRFKTAFTRYAIDDVRMRCLKAALGNGGDSAAIHAINAHERLLLHSERKYRYVRLEYVRRLLTEVTPDRQKLAA